MSRLHDTGETFGEGNVTLLMILGVLSYTRRMNGALGSRSSRRRSGGAAAAGNRHHPVDLAVLGVESFGRSVAGLCGPEDRRKTGGLTGGRTPRPARPKPRALRQVLR